MRPRWKVVAVALGALAFTLFVSVTSVVSFAYRSPSLHVEELSTATVSGLKYDATADQYIYNWKTLSTYAGTCRKFTLTLADGTVHTALLKFTK